MTDAREYGKALFLITEEDGVTDKVIEDIKLVCSVFKENPDYSKLLNTPAIPKEKRTELLDSAFSSIDGRLLNLIKILCEKRATQLFDKAMDAFFDLYNESRGILEVEAVTAIALTNSQMEAIKAKLASLLNKTIILKNKIDKSTLGGVKLRYSGIQLDGSIKTRLDSFESTLRKTVI